MHPYLAIYIHHLDPFAIQFTETFGIRWYGLAYVAGFLAAFFLIQWFVKLKASELKSAQVADFITWGAIGGVMLGGRIGYMFLYNFDAFRNNPLIFFDIMGGGMASHGGIIGLCIFAYIYSKITKLSWAGLGDNLCTVVPVGLFFGRIANFINGELYGRETTSSLAMKFPDELSETVKTGGGEFWWLPLESLQNFTVKVKDIAPELKVNVENLIAKAKVENWDPHRSVVEKIVEVSNANPEVREQLGELLTPRHPSQLYEAAVEGLLLFVILLAVRLKWKNLYHGILTGLFFLLYAIGRIICEQFREPDSSLIGPLTKGQFYSTFMVVVGVAFIVWALKTKRRNRLPGE